MNPVENKKPNRLIASSSPYLLQHAYNPVDWHEWGAEALDKAKKHDIPILVSIGYSACHWCHVMERESFENEDIAAIMNAHFVCIKIDREERPDLDQIYMEAIQAMQMHGGWPLNVFLTPDQIPFYGGTYFPPRNWSQLLISLEKAFRERRTEIEKSAEALKEHLQASDVDRFARHPGDAGFSLSNLDKMFHVLQSRFDHNWGGIEKAPKFVMPSIWMFLLRYYQVSKNPDALSMVVLTLKKMTSGGLFDVVGGGFSRYSVDGHWFAPHFEKMLYDNAQLLSLYSEAFSITQEAEFKWIVSETVKWIELEMINSEGGVYSALDADSEGVEGKFYTWTWDEISQQLDEPMLEYFGITREGNWEHGRNILCRPGDINSFKINYQLKEGDIEHFLEEARKKLRIIRSTRIRPGLDDKILSGWNAMLVQGLVDAYRALDDEKYLALAMRIMSFVKRHLISDGKLYRTYRQNRSATEGFLEDYAFLIQSHISLYEVTFDESWLWEAKKWCDYTLENFFDKKTGYFSFTSVQAEKLIARKKEIFDNVIPSSNSVMARNLLRIGIMLDHPEWVEKSKAMMRSLVTLTAGEPGSMSNWGILLIEMTKGLSEIVIIGKDSSTFRRKLHKKYVPLSVTMGTTGNSDLPHFEGRKSIDERTLIYVCRNKVCQLPVDNIDSAIDQVNT